MVVPRSIRRCGRRIPTDGRTSTSPDRRDRRRRRSVRTRVTAVIGFVALFAGTLSSGALAQIRWGERGLELSTGAAAVTGLVLFGVVAAAVLALTRRNEGSGGGVETAAGTDGADDAETDTPETLTGESAEDAQVALVRDESGDWTWRVVHLEALAERPDGVETRSTATDRVEHLQSVIESAGVREVPDAAIRLSADGDGAWRWTLVREDGREIAAAPTAYDDRDAAEQAVSFLKDRGPDADVVDLEGAALTLTERDDRWRWRLVDDERTPLAASPDAYERRADAEAAAERFAETVSEARVLDVETIGVELRPVADADGTENGIETGDENETDGEDGTETGDETDGENGTETEDETGDENGPGERWTWRLVDDADEVVADATVAFDDRPTAEAAATSVLEELDEAAVTVADEAAYERYPDPDANETDPGADGTGWRWRLTDATDRVVARAPTPVADRDAAKRAVELFRETAPDADVLEIDDAAYEVYPASGRDTGTGSETSDASGIPSSAAAADASEPDEDRAVAASDGGTEAVEAASDGWRWRLVTEDRDVLATSPDPYADAEAAASATERIRERARDADVTAFETAAFRVYEDETGEWRWRLLDAGGAVLADSDAAHDSRNEAIEAMLTLQERAPDAEVVEIETAEFELFEVDDGEGWSWRLIDAAGALVAAAPTSYPSLDAARAAVERVRERVDAATHTMDRAAFQPVADGAVDAWRWRFVLPTGELLATSAAEYTTRDELVEHLSAIREAAATDRTHATGAVTVQLHGDDAWRWRLLDRDRTPIAESAGAYADREAARSAIEEIERTGADAPVFTIDDAAIQLERAGGRERPESGAEDGDGGEADTWRWELVDGDRNVLATAARPESRADLEATVDDVQRLAPSADTVAVTGASFDLVEATGERESESADGGDDVDGADPDDPDADWRWRLLDADDDPVAVASRAAASKVAARETIAEVRTLLENATVIELEDAVFELYATDEERGDETRIEAVGDGAWAWRLLDAQGETLLESTRTYESRTAARRAIGTLQTQLPAGSVTVAE